MKRILIALAAAACSRQQQPPPVTQSSSLAITAVDAMPGQVNAGDAVTLAWSTTGAERATLAEGAGQPTDVLVSDSLVVRPAATTLYTLVVYNKAGLTPASLTAQGEASTLSWSGNATRYSITDGTTGAILDVGPRRSVVVRPSASTTYTLTATGPGGPLSSARQAIVAVTRRPATGLTYDPPTAVAPLELVADACAGPPCTSVAFKILATMAVHLRGAALNLPLDPTKVSFVDTSFGLGSRIAAADSKATLGSGALQDVLVLGIALRGSSNAPAPDVTLNAGDELAHFTLATERRPRGGPSRRRSRALRGVRPIRLRSAR